MPSGNESSRPGQPEFKSADSAEWLQALGLDGGQAKHERVASTEYAQSLEIKEGEPKPAFVTYWQELAGALDGQTALDPALINQFRTNQRRFEQSQARLTSGEATPDDALEWYLRTGALNELEGAGDYLGLASYTLEQTPAGDPKYAEHQMTAGCMLMEMSMLADKNLSETAPDTQTAVIDQQEMLEARAAALLTNASQASSSRYAQRMKISSPNHPAFKQNGDQYRIQPLVDEMTADLHLHALKVRALRREKSNPPPGLSGPEKTQFFDEMRAKKRALKTELIPVAKKMTDHASINYEEDGVISGFSGELAIALGMDAAISGSTHSDSFHVRHAMPREDYPHDGLSHSTMSNGQPMPRQAFDLQLVSDKPLHPGGNVPPETEGCIIQVKSGPDRSVYDDVINKLAVRTLGRDFSQQVIAAYTGNRDDEMQRLTSTIFTSPAFAKGIGADIKQRLFANQKH